MKHNLAFALGGGGSKGALQVGALRALFEAGLKPEFLTGTSIGAMNAVGLGLWGLDITTIDKLEAVWKRVEDLQLMDSRFQNLIIRAMLHRPDTSSQQKTIDFLTSIGLTEDLTFGDISTVRLGLVSADLTSGSPVIYGLNPCEKILEGCLASIAIQPWFMPVQINGQYLVDGGFVSNVPIEAALLMGASGVIALDLNAPDSSMGDSVNQYIDRVTFTVTSRITYLEIQLARAQGIPVYHMTLTGSNTPSSDFSKSTELFAKGYEQAESQIAQWLEKEPDFIAKSMASESA
ncbi:MAG: patatin-like phospholipase family protein [Anaerolineaceae bacterium]